MEEQSKKNEVKNESPKKAQKRRRRITVAEKLVERKNNKANNHGAKSDKPAKNGDSRGETGKGVGTKIRQHRGGGNGQSNSEERKNSEKRFDNRIPDRWLLYSIAINQPIENTRFLAFKTPLGELFFDEQKFKDRQQHRFEVDTVVSHVTSLKLSLGLVIDLTNTNRYYDFSLWSKHKVQYVKIRCPGHEVSESEEIYQLFRKEVKQFVEQRENSVQQCHKLDMNDLTSFWDPVQEDTFINKLVGVHCTHGLNRTGYLICRYLIEESGWSALNAIEGFRVARGYPMERPKYIESLKEAEKKLSVLRVGGES